MFSDTNQRSKYNCADQPNLNLEEISRKIEMPHPTYASEKNKDDNPIEEYLADKPEEVMMFAAHMSDLQSACSYGLRTGFIYRPNEYGGGPVGVPDKAKPGDFDVVSMSIIDLAQQMGA